MSKLNFGPPLKTLTRHNLPSRPKLSTRNKPPVPPKPKLFTLRKTLQDLPNELLEKIVMSSDLNSFVKLCMTDKKFANFCQRYEKELYCYREIKRLSNIKFYGIFKDIKHIVCDIYDLVVSSGIRRGKGNNNAYFAYAAEQGLLNIVKFFYNQGDISSHTVDKVIKNLTQKIQFSFHIPSYAVEVLPNYDIESDIIEFLLKLNVSSEDTLYEGLLNIAGSGNLKLFKLTIKYILKNFYSNRPLHPMLGNAMVIAERFEHSNIVRYIINYSQGPDRV